MSARSSCTVIERFNRALGHALVHCPAFHSTIINKKTGYRNKITYSLTRSGPLSPITDQAMPILNQICSACNELSQTDEFARFNFEKQVNASDDKKDEDKQKNSDAKVPTIFFVEVAVKITRLNEVMLKLMVTRLRAQEFVDSGSAARFAAQLHSQFPQVRCFVLHVAPEGALKAAKQTASCDEGDATVGGEYIPIPVSSLSSLPATTAVAAGATAAVSSQQQEQQSAALSHLTDLTPNNIPLRISVDAFTEVNPEVEVHLFDTVREFLGLRERTHESTDDDSLLPVSLVPVFYGRDCNIQYLSHSMCYHAKRSGAVLATQCTRAAQDAMKEMKLPVTFLNLGKDAVGSAIFQAVSAIAQQQHQQHPHANSTDGKRNSRVLVDFHLTAGRHGLHPNLAASLIHNISCINNLLMTSCNVDSLTKDLHILRLHFSVCAVRSFDFFPGTRYRMTMVLLRPHQVRRLVVLPIGPPGANKSSCCRAAQRAFEDDAVNDSNDDDDCENAKRAQKSQNIKKSTARGAAVVQNVRGMRRQRENIAVRIFERDHLYAERRNAGASLAATKSELHESLMQFLSGGGNHNNGGNLVIDIVDSTNGSREQRAEYCRRVEQASSSSSRVIAIFFDATNLAQQRPQQGGRDNDDDAICSSLPNPTASIVEALLQRCSARVGHPAFPSERDEARKKIESIVAAIEAPAMETRSDDLCRSFSVDCALDAAQLEIRFSWILFLSLFCEPVVAQRIIKDGSSAWLS